MGFPQFDFEVEAVIHCALWFTLPPLPLHIKINTNQESPTKTAKPPKGPPWQLNKQQLYLQNKYFPRCQQLIIDEPVGPGRLRVDGI